LSLGEEVQFTPYAAAHWTMCNYPQTARSRRAPALREGSAGTYFDTLIRRCYCELWECEGSSGTVVIDHEVADRWSLLSAAARNSEIAFSGHWWPVGSYCLGTQSDVGYQRYWTDSYYGRGSFQLEFTAVRSTQESR